MVLCFVLLFAFASPIYIARIVRDHSVLGLPFLGVIGASQVSRPEFVRKINRFAEANAASVFDDEAGDGLL